MPTTLRTGVRRIAWFFSMSILLLQLTSCGKDEAASGALIGPSVGPRVDESLLALGVIAGAPVGITAIFERTDEVHLWVRWANLVPTHEAEAVWLNPAGTEIAAAVVTITDGPTNQVTDFLLQLTPSSTLGRWEVLLYLDGDLQRSHVFDVIPSP